MLDLLDALQQGGRAAGDLTLERSLHAALSSLNSCLTFFMFSADGSIVLALEDVFSRAARGELQVFSEIIAMTRAEMVSVRERYRAFPPDRNGIPEGGETARKLQQLHDYIWAFESGGDRAHPVESFRHFLGRLDIDPELLKILSPENVHDLMQAVERGEQICEVKVHLESNEEMAARFLAWIDSSRSKIITNRSIFIDDKSWYEMLMVSPLPRSEIKAVLAELDPNVSFLHLKPQSGANSEHKNGVKTGDCTPELPVQTAAAADISGTVIRVHGETLDSFMNLIGEMTLAQSRFNHIMSDERLTTLMASFKQQYTTHDSDTAELLELLAVQRRDLEEAGQLLHNSLGRLQESALGLRVVPVEMVFKRLPRMVRDFARNQGKNIRLEMNGQDVKIDKAMVEILTDPLLHLVRNSIDHGVETPEKRVADGKAVEAVIRVSAVQSGSSIVFEVSDDGAGIDADRVLQIALERRMVTKEAAASLSREELLRFIFLPGFSTATVVSETSGRGVGMDVVMTNVMRIGGTIAIDSLQGRGTTFTLRMPMSVAIQEVLMVEASGQTLALPGRYIREVLDVAADEMQTVRGEQAILLRGAFLPLYRLSLLLGYPSAPRHRGDCVAVVLTNGSETIGIEVDAVLRRQELFVKDIQASVAALPGIGGASILGNGHVVLILDGEDLLRLAKRSRAA